ncbi:MAG TPA: beta-ketoacyl-[acyl-carrier-protein] synthase family protein [Tepidisphaeraceae bacterium]|jgi:3-oxoacyl-[acyl-carrier-protein] synthase II|nr:beta-ketoacyl-[acyl-carrier-protein] synthase family protein [Tepidisphaeraceae bacterium]
MSNHRTVITGYGAITPIGYSVAETMAALDAGACATRPMTPGWNKYAPLQCQVVAPVELRDPKAIPRSFRRTMSPMSIMAVQAAVAALNHAGIDPAAIPADSRFGCIMGSTTGSSQGLARTYELLLSKTDYAQLGASEFFQCVSHTVALNVAQFFGIKGVVSATSAACASGLQAVGAAYDQITLGRQDVMLCGGAEELHESVVGSFDILYAASSRFNASPSRTPRPFDVSRDGLVCGEGAGVIVLENLEHALRRGARIIAEVVGYHTCSNGTHVSQSDDISMAACMNTALESAGMSPGEVGYVNAHATGTPQGDAAEARAIAAVFGDRVPVSSLKGNMGHTLGGSGPIELAATLEMMRSSVVYPTHNLQEISCDCAAVQHVQRKTEHHFSAFLKNSFAFGGINSAIACRIWR